jgi:hypothetical protein
MPALVTTIDVTTERGGAATLIAVMARRRAADSDAPC